MRAVTGSAASARRIASRLALRMLLRSMPSAQTDETPMPSAVFRIVSKSASRCSAVRRFESSSPLGMRLGLSTTAAATTGPASGPRPASSSPATGQSPSLIAFFSNAKSGFWSSSKRGGESERARAMLRRCSHRFRFSARPSRPLGWRSGRLRRQPGTGWTDFFARPPQRPGGNASIRAASAARSSSRPGRRGRF